MLKRVLSIFYSPRLKKLYTVYYVRSKARRYLTRLGVQLAARTSRRRRKNALCDARPPGGKYEVVCIKEPSRLGFMLLFLRRRRNARCSTYFSREKNGT